MPKHTERDFETAIEAGLTGDGGYESRAPSAYDETLALPARRRFRLPEGQPAGQVGGARKAPWAEDRRDRAGQPLEGAGPQGHAPRPAPRIQVLRQDVTHGLVPAEHNHESPSAENYAKNRLTVTRQVAFTSVMKKPDGKNRRCVIDVTLAVNGIPVLTAELKNPLTGQRAADAVRQYKEERDGRDLLFAFKKRALVHFAVDPDELWMTTRLRGKDTYFLPFNRGDDQGAGNPPVEGNWKTITSGTRRSRPTACWKSCSASCTSK